MRKYRILWMSNAPHVPTGYGQQTRIFSRLIKDDGHTIYIASNFGVIGAPLFSAEGILVLPSGVDAWANDIIGSHYKNIRADVVITLYDPHPLDTKVYQRLAWCAWSPIDSNPIYGKTLKALQHASYIWAMSHMGERLLVEAGFNADFISYVPHGFENNVFTIHADIANAKKTFSELINRDITNSYFVVMNGTNRTLPPRKGFVEALYAFKEFQSKHKDALLYIHTEELGLLGGVHFPDLLEAIGIDPLLVIFPDQYSYMAGMLLPGYMSYMYNSADLVLHTAKSGGFEIPLIEAQACGIPVIYPNAEPFSEIVYNGYPVSTVPDLGWNHTIWHTSSIPSIVDALEQAFNDGIPSEQRRIKIADGVAHLESHKVYENYMKPALAKMEMELFPSDSCSKVWNFSR